MHVHNKCKIFNVLHAISFIVTAPNFIPFDLTLFSTSSTTVTLNWTVPTTSPDADGYVLYCTMASGNGPGMAQKVVGGDVTECTLEGLTPNTLYTISIRAYQDILGPASGQIAVMTNASEGALLFKIMLA